VHEAEREEAMRRAADDRRDRGVRALVVGRKRGEQHAVRDAGIVGAPQVIAERRVGVPRAGEAVALSGVDVRVDDHRASSPRNAADVAIALPSIASE
jgi:hypothetical protein